MSKRTIKITDQLINYAVGKGRTSTNRVDASWREYQHTLENKGGQIWDSDISGFHILRSKNALSFRYSYRVLGKRRTFTIGQFPALTTPSARERVRALALSVANGVDPLQVQQDTVQIRKSTPTLLEYLEGDYSVYLRLRAKRWASYIQLVKNAFPELLPLPITEIEKRHIVKWLDAQMALVGQRHYAPATIRQRYSTLKSLMAHAYRDDLISSSAFDKMGKLEFRSSAVFTTDAQRRRYLELDQQRALLSAIDAYDEHLRAQRRNTNTHRKTNPLPSLDHLPHASHHRPMYLLLFYCGMRQGDVLGLDWSHVHDTKFKKAIIKVLEKTERHVSTPTTIELSEPVLAALRGWHSQTGSPPEGLVFPSERLLTQGRADARMCDTTLSKSWIWIKREAKLESTLQLYSLRHNFASWLILNNTPLKTVASMLGHQSTEMVDRHYGHLISGETQKANSAFAELLEKRCVSLAGVLPLRKGERA